MIKVISGGQTGVDRGALDAAIAVGIPHGGFKPADGKSEDGVVPLHYDLDYHWQKGYHGRTLENVRSSDATVILYRPGSYGPGTRLTKSLCHWLKKPVVEVPFLYMPDLGSAAELDAFLLTFDTINFAGGRESTNPGIQKEVETFLIPYFGRAMDGGVE